MFKDFDLSKMTQMLSQAQQKANEFEESLATKEFESKSGGGLISVKINGKSEILCFRRLCRKRSCAFRNRALHKRRAGYNFPYGKNRYHA